MSHGLYRPRWLSDEDMFRSRIPQMERALSELVVPQRSHVVFGEANIGKTHFGKRLFHSLRESNRCIVSVWVQCAPYQRTIEGSLVRSLMPSSEGTTLFDILGRDLIDMALRTYGLELPMPDKAHSKRSLVRAVFQEVLSMAAQAGPGSELFVFLDDVGSLQDRAGLGSLIKETTVAQFVLIGVADNVRDLISDYELARARISGTELGALEVADLRDLLGRQAQNCQPPLQIDNDVISKLHRMTAGSPVLLERLASNAAMLARGRAEEMIVPLIGFEDLTRAAENALASQALEHSDFDVKRVLKAKGQECRVLIGLANSESYMVDRRALGSVVAGLSQEKLNLSISALVKKGILREKAPDLIGFATPMCRLAAALEPTGQCTQPDRISPRSSGTADLVGKIDEMAEGRLSVPQSPKVPSRKVAIGRLELKERVQDMNKHQSDCVDVAILVALEKELEAVLRSNGNWNRHEHSNDIRTYYTCTTATGLSVVAARSSGMGQINAALLARDVVALFKPRKVILVGIAAGLGKDVSLGDIVISDQVVDYELGKVTADGSTPRWSVYRSDALLRERLIDHQDRKWLDLVHAVRPDGKPDIQPKIHSGVVLSGNKVIADAATAGALAAVWSRAAAIEMEAAGIGAALHQATDAPGFVMVKAICDRADASKDDSWQQYAAEVAAAFVSSFVFSLLKPTDAKVRISEKKLPVADSAVDFRAIRLALSAAFDLSELRILVSDLGLDWDNIGGRIKDEKIVELLWSLNRRAKLAKLIEVVRSERPGLLDAYSADLSDSSQ